MSENERKRQRRMVLLVFVAIGIVVVSGVACSRSLPPDDEQPHSRPAVEQEREEVATTSTDTEVKAGREEGRHCVLVGNNSEEPTLVDGVWFCRGCFPPNVDSAIYDWGERTDSQMFKHRRYDKGALSWWKNGESFGFVQDYTANLNDLPMRAVGSFDKECK